ncbi:MAG: hypothetical protein AAGG69_03440 [Pseudomonadota bacterium]
MKNALTLAAAGVVAVMTITTPAIAAETDKDLERAVTQTEEFAAPLGTKCTRLDTKSDRACANALTQQKRSYPSAPVFPHVGI